MSKWFSRKLLVAIASVIGIPAAELPQESWYVALGYILVQGVIDLVKTYRSIPTFGDDDE